MQTLTAGATAFRMVRRWSRPTHVAMIWVARKRPRPTQVNGCRKCNKVSRLIASAVAKFCKEIVRFCCVNTSVRLEVVLDVVGDDEETRRGCERSACSQTGASLTFACLLHHCLIILEEVLSLTSSRKNSQLHWEIVTLVVIRAASLHRMTELA